MPGRLTVCGGALALLLPALVTGCGAARSDCMRAVADGLPLSAPPDAALVVFVRHEGSPGTLYTVMDEQKRFLGESAVRSRFSVTMAPGDHLFIAWDDHGPNPNGFTFEVMGAASDAPDLPRIEPLQASLSRAKVYVVEVGPKGSLRARPPASGDAALAGTSAYAPDVARGQATLDRAPMRLERIRQKAIELLDGYRYGDVALHRMHAADGR
jgi:hypothetical protein